MNLPTLLAAAVAIAYLATVEAIAADVERRIEAWEAAAIDV